MGRIIATPSIAKKTVFRWYHVFPAICTSYILLELPIASVSLGLPRKICTRFCIPLWLDCLSLWVHTPCWICDFFCAPPHRTVWGLFLFPIFNLPAEKQAGESFLGHFSSCMQDLWLPMCESGIFFCLFRWIDLGQKSLSRKTAKAFALYALANGLLREQSHTCREICFPMQFRGFPNRDRSNGWQVFEAT